MPGHCVWRWPTFKRHWGGVCYVHTLPPSWSRPTDYRAEWIQYALPDQHANERGQANTRRWTSAGLMLGQRRSRWATIGPALGQCLTLAVSVDKQHCVLHIAVVPKRNNKFRWIQNLRPVRVVNDSCCKVTFQCEDIKTVAQLIEPRDDLDYCRYKQGPSRRN